jgi:hypothetical protein
MFSAPPKRWLRVTAPHSTLRPLSLALRTENPLMTRNTIDSAAPLAAGLLQMNLPLAPMELTT